MSLLGIIDDSQAPLSSWRDGNLVYATATALPMTAAQARAAAQGLIEHAEAIERTDPDAGKAASFGLWTSIHAAGQCTVCNEWEQRRAGRVCTDCDGGPGPCTCQIAERPYLSVQTMVLGVCRDCHGPAEAMICGDCLMKRGA